MAKYPQALRTVYLKFGKTILGGGHDISKITFGRQNNSRNYIFFFWGGGANFYNI